MEGNLVGEYMGKIKECILCYEKFETVPYGSHRIYCFNCVPSAHGDNPAEKRVVTHTFRRAVKKNLLGTRDFCEKCGYHKNIMVLEFHHKDPTQKDLTIVASKCNRKMLEKLQEESRKCSVLCGNCHQEKHEEIELSLKKKYSAVSKSRQKRKRDLVEYLGGKCQTCGYDKSIYALCFHHRDPSSKSYGLGDGNCRSWEEDLKEADKCDLLCINCHNEIHYK